MRNPAVNTSLERAISLERLGKYLDSTNGELDEALALYERNTQLSEAFYTPLQCVEVCLRNTVNHRMTEMYGDGWFQNGNAPLKNEACRMIEDAYDGIYSSEGDIPHGKIVAELKFAFWVNLLGSGYDATTWRKTVYKAFQSGSGRPRSKVHSRFNVIRRFRNRIAHHEPIFHRPLEQLHEEIIEAISWMCPDTAAWAAHQSRFDEINNSN